MATISLAVPLNIINTYINPTIFALGTSGSLLNIWLFSRRRLRSNACCTYFFSSSFAALILLTNGLIPLIYTRATSINIFTTNSSFCKARGYITQVSAMACRWLLVAACIDRCLACSNSVRFRRFSSVRIARYLSILIFIFWSIIPIHMPIYLNIIITPRTSSCIFTKTEVAIYHGIYTIIMGGTLPPIILIVSTKIIWQILRQRMFRRTLVSIERQHSHRDDQILFILLVQVLIFMISNIPFVSNNLYLALTRNVTNKSADRLIIEGFIQVVAELLVYIFPASLFFSSTLASRTFRSELIRLLAPVLGCSKRSRRTVATLNSTANQIRMTTINVNRKRTDMPTVEIL